MQYKAEVMGRTELGKMPGITLALLDRAYREPGQRFAWKTNPTARNSPMFFETAKFEEWRLKDIEMQAKAARGTRGIA